MIRGSEPSRRVTILGSTGSVGSNTVDLIERNRDAFAVEALTAASNVATLAAQARSDPDFYEVYAFPKFQILVGDTPSEILDVHENRRRPTP